MMLVDVNATPTIINWGSFPQDFLINRLNHYVIRMEDVGPNTFRCAVIPPHTTKPGCITRNTGPSIVVINIYIWFSTNARSVTKRSRKCHEKVTKVSRKGHKRRILQFRHLNCNIRHLFYHDTRNKI